MSEVGSCADNATAESFFGVLKRERVNRTAVPDPTRGESEYLKLHRTLAHPPPASETGVQQQGEKLLTQASVETG